MRVSPPSGPGGESTPQRAKSGGAGSSEALRYHSREAFATHRVSIVLPESQHPRYIIASLVARTPVCGATLALFSSNSKVISKLAAYEHFWGLGWWMWQILRLDPYKGTSIVPESRFSFYRRPDRAPCPFQGGFSKSLYPPNHYWSDSQAQPRMNLPR